MVWRLPFRLILSFSLFQQYLIEKRAACFTSLNLILFHLYSSIKWEKSLYSFFSSLSPFPRACSYRNMFLCRLASWKNCPAAHTILIRISKANWKLYWNGFFFFFPLIGGREVAGLVFFNLLMIIKGAVRCEMKACTWLNAM